MSDGKPITWLFFPVCGGGGVCCVRKKKKRMGSEFSFSFTQTKANKKRGKRT
jgi:hypothetical protein